MKHRILLSLALVALAGAAPAAELHKNASFSGTSTFTGTLVLPGGVSITAVTGTGSVVLSTSPTLVTPTLTTPTLVTPLLGVATAASVAVSDGTDALTLTTAGIARTGANVDLPLTLAPKGAGSISIGTGNTVGGTSAVAIGTGNVASGQFAQAFGQGAAAANDGQMAHASGMFSAPGDAQFTRSVFRATTPDTTPVPLVVMSLQNAKAYCIRLTVGACGSGAGSPSFFTRKLLVTVDGMGTASILSNEAIGSDVDGTSGGGITLSAAGGTATLIVTVAQGASPSSTRWVGVVEAVEIGANF